MTAAEFSAQFGGGKPASPVNVGRNSTPKPQIRIPKRAEPNKTEAEFEQIAKRTWVGASIKYEAITLRLNSGKYTPDWVVFEGTRIICIVECKGSHLHHSSSGSIRAFKEALVLFPWPFLFAQKTKSGWLYSTPIEEFK